MTDAELARHHAAACARARAAGVGYTLTPRTAARWAALGVDAPVPVTVCGWCRAPLPRDDGACPHCGSPEVVT